MASQQHFCLDSYSDRNFGLKIRPSMEFNVINILVH